MIITCDPAKRAAILAMRDLDILDADQVFAGTTFEFEDDRHDYGERRMIAIGKLQGRMIVLVYVDRIAGRHVISMRKANDRERQRYEARLERS